MRRKTPKREPLRAVKCARAAARKCSLFLALSRALFRARTRPKRHTFGKRVRITTSRWLKQHSSTPPKQELSTLGREVTMTKREKGCTTLHACGIRRSEFLLLGDLFIFLWRGPVDLVNKFQIPITRPPKNGTSVSPNIRRQNSHPAHFCGDRTICHFTPKNRTAATTRWRRSPHKYGGCSRPGLVGVH